MQSEAVLACCETAKQASFEKNDCSGKCVAQLVLVKNKRETTWDVIYLSRNWNWDTESRSAHTH